MLELEEQMHVHLKIKKFQKWLTWKNSMVHTNLKIAEIVEEKKWFWPVSFFVLYTWLLKSIQSLEIGCMITL